MSGDDTEMGGLKDRRVGVAIDGNDDLGVGATVTGGYLSALTVGASKSIRTHAA